MPEATARVRAPSRAQLAEIAERDARNATYGRDEDGPTAARETSVHDRLDELAQQVQRLEGMASGLFVSTTGDALDPTPLDQYDRGVMGRLTHSLERLSRVIVITERVCDLLGFDNRDAVPVSRDR